MSAYAIITSFNLNKSPLSYLVKNFATINEKKKTSNKSFLLDFGYVESVGSV
jgi:hypothetical protein